MTKVLGVALFLGLACIAGGAWSAFWGRAKDEEPLQDQRRRCAHHCWNPWFGDGPCANRHGGLQLVGPSSGERWNLGNRLEPIWL